MSTFTTPSVPPAPDVLNSWKEIACYLNRGVRTVQRWESELGMPVRRPRGKSRSAVIALRTELDEWLKACPVNVREQLATRQGHAVQPRGGNSSVLMLQCQELRSSVGAQRIEFQAALERLMWTLEKMAGASAGHGA